MRHSPSTWEATSQVYVKATEAPHKVIAVLLRWWKSCVSPWSAGETCPETGLSVRNSEAESS